MEDNDEDGEDDLDDALEQKVCDAMNERRLTFSAHFFHTNTTVEQKKMEVIVVSSAKFTMNRDIGHSQGLLHGRYRNGLVCKWTGYAPEYFVFHAFRYIFRKPYIIGSIWMIYGYITSSPGPYPQRLRLMHAEMQRKRLKALFKNPIRNLIELYM
jgi:hypothetical protein